VVEKHRGETEKVKEKMEKSAGSTPFIPAEVTKSIRGKFAVRCGERDETR
jgi:F0F1-type ATP synthase delta subunit